METINISKDELKRLIEMSLKMSDSSMKLCDGLMKILRAHGDEEKKDLHTKGGVIPHGTKLRAIYKGKQFDGFTNGGIKVDGLQGIFNSPSKAAHAVAQSIGVQKPSINGWAFWRYFDENTGVWKKLSHLRKIINNHISGSCNEK